jgi:hypothetical protein
LCLCLLWRGGGSGGGSGGGGQADAALWSAWDREVCAPPEGEHHVVITHGRGRLLAPLLLLLLLLALALVLALLRILLLLIARQLQLVIGGWRLVLLGLLLLL